MAVGRDVERLVVVKETQNIGRRRTVHHTGGYDLVHRLVVLKTRWVVDEACTAAIDVSGKERDPERLVVRNTLERANQVGSLEILY